VGVIAGLVGCFGGMSLAAALCSYLIVTREARLGMNGPEVIEQEAGIAELDASDRTMIWDLIGGTQRSKVGMVDRLVVDDTTAVLAAVNDCYALGVPATHRTEQVDTFISRLAAVDTSRQYDGAALQAMWTSTPSQTKQGELK